MVANDRVVEAYPASYVSRRLPDEEPAPPRLPVQPIGEVSAPSPAPVAEVRPLDSMTEVAWAGRRVAGRPGPRTVLHANEATFEQHVLRSDVPVLVDFYASWCGPCKKLSPTLDEIAAESPNARVVKVNIDDSPRLASLYGVQSVPSLMAFKDGRVVARQKGVASKARLVAMLDL